MATSNGIKKNNQKIFLFSAITIFFIFCIYYFVILYLHIDTDIPVHASIAWSFFNNHDHISPNFLYFFLVALVAGFTKYKTAYYISSIFILAIAIAFKFLLNVFYVKKYISNEINNWQAIALSASLLFIFCLPNIDFLTHKIFYLGQLAPNVWHNSTVIFLFPFAVLLFFKSYEFLYSDKPGKKLQRQIILLILLNALIKPSFLFTIIPAVFIVFFFRLLIRNKKTIGYNKLLPFAAGFFFIAIEYFIIYRLNYSSKVMSVSDNSKVIFSPFTVWRHFSNNIPFAIITSLFFPLVYIFITAGKPLKNELVLFSSINFILGICIWIFFAESGFREFHGNFYWQVVITSYLFFFTLLLHFVNSIQANEFSKAKQTIIGGAFIIHLLWGIFYWVKIIIFKGYS